MKTGHVVLFPFLAQGHIIPFIALARFIEQQSLCTITLITTPLNITKLQSLLPSDSTIHLAELPFCSSNHGLPPDIENLETLPSHLMATFLQATETLQPSFQGLIRHMIHQGGCTPLCIVSDMFLGWIVETANKFGAFHSVFLTCGAYSSAIMFSLCLHPPPSFAFSEVISLEDYPEIRLNKIEVLNTILTEGGMNPVIDFIRRQLSFCYQSTGFLLNTVEELEIEGISLLRRWPGLPLWVVGPLVKQISCHEDDTTIKWLSLHAPASVLYVSFGSQSTITAAQMMELAKGLEAGGQPFIWVIRPPSEFETSKKFREEWLPEGFEERIGEKKQGLLVHGWAPQLEILSHGSIGAFLSHCGWNSVLECLSMGVPIIGWPLLADQLFNSRMLVEMGLCIEVASGKIAGGLQNGWEDIARVTKLVMGEMEKGKEMKRKANEIKEIMRRALKDETTVGSSLKAMKEFLQTAFSPRV